MYAINPAAIIESPVTALAASLFIIAFYPQLTFSPAKPSINSVAFSNCILHLLTYASNSSFSALALAKASSNDWSKSITSFKAAYLADNFSSAIFNDSYNDFILFNYVKYIN